MKLSYFTGEQRSENYEQILCLAEELGYSVQVYESKEVNQFDFLQAVYRDTATIVDATIPDDLTFSTVYPILTAQINCLDHILVFSDNLYEDGTQMLPLNISPQRERTQTDQNLLTWLKKQLLDLKEHQYYGRIDIESVDSLALHQKEMEEIILASLDMHRPQKSDETRVLISYKSSFYEDVMELKEREEAKGKVSVQVLPSGYLCDEKEAHTPMRRWMLVGLLEDIIRGKDEVWAYYNDTFSHSWWTLAEMVMVAYINYDRCEEDKVKLRVYDARNDCFMERGKKDYPEYLHVKLSVEQHRKLARYLSNTRPDAMGPENNGNIKKMKRIAFVMRLFTQSMRLAIVGQMKPMFEMMVPKSLPEDERKELVKDLMELYSKPDKLRAYANDPVFREEFWYNISYQAGDCTPAFRNKAIDIDRFMETPMEELTRYKDKDLRAAVKQNTQIGLKGKEYGVREGKKRYLWLATRMGRLAIKDAPGIEIIQTYKLIERDK